MPNPIDILLRVLEAKNAADQIAQVTAANRQLADAVQATAPAQAAAAGTLRAETEAAKAAVPQLERVATAETAAAAAETRATAARAGHTAEIQRQTLATEKLAVAGRATVNAATAAANASRGLSTTTRQSLIYTLSDLISTSGSGFSLQRFALQQGPQLLQGALASSSLSLGAMAAYGAGFAVAAAPLIKVLKDLTEIIRLKGDALALTTSTNRFTTTALASMIEQRRRAGQLSDEDAQRLQARNRSTSDTQAVEPPSPWLALFSRVPGYGHAEAKAAQEKAARDIEERNMALLRDLQAATTAGHAAMAEKAQALADQSLAKKQAELATDLAILRDWRANANAVYNDLLAGRLAAISHAEQQEREIHRQGYEAELANIEKRLAAKNTEIAREQANKDKVASLTAERIQLETQLTAAVDREVSERRAIEDRARAERVQAINSDWTMTPAEKYRETKRQIEAGDLPPSAKPDGPDPDSLPQQWQARLEEQRAQIGTVMEDLSAVMISPIQGFRDGFSSALDELIAKGGTAGEFFRGIAAGIGASMRRAFVDMVADWVTSHIVMKGVALAYEGFLKMLRWAGVLDANAAEAAKTPALAANATLASIGSFGTAAVIGVAAIAAILAAVGAFADGGLVRGPGGPREDRVLARLSNGEHVTNAAAVSRLGERFMAGLNAGVVDLGSLAPGANVRGGAGGGLGGGAAGGGVNVRNEIVFAGVYDSAAAFLKAKESPQVQTFLLDFMRNHVHEITGRG